MTELLEKLEILHIARADLNQIDIGEQVNVGKIHDLGDDRHSGLFLRLEKKLETFGAKSLECVGRCAGLERAAAEHRCARRRDFTRD